MPTSSTSTGLVASVVRSKRVLSSAVLSLAILSVSSGCSSQSGPPTAPVQVVHTSGGGLPTLPVGPPASGSASPTQTSGQSVSAGTPGSLLLKTQIYEWYLKVAPAYSKLAKDFASLTIAINDVDEGRVRVMCKQLKLDAAALGAIPAAPDAQAQLSIEQTVKYIDLGADQCLSGTFEVGEQNFENARQWAVELQQRVSQLAKS